MNNYRITFYNNKTDKSKKFDIKARNSAEVDEFINNKAREMRDKDYTDATYHIVEDGLKTIGLEILYTDTVFKKDFKDYLFIKAENENEAIEIFNKEYKNQRFWFNCEKLESDGKCIIKKVTNTYYV